MKNATEYLKIIYIWNAETDMKTTIIAVISQLNSCENKAWKNSTLNGIWPHDLCNSGAVLHQLNYQANRELVTLWGRIYSYIVKKCKWIYEISNGLNYGKDMRTSMIIPVTYITTAVKLKKAKSSCMKGIRMNPWPLASLSYWCIHFSFSGVQIYDFSFDHCMQNKVQQMYLAIK